MLKNGIAVIKVTKGNIFNLFSILNSHGPIKINKNTINCDGRWSFFCAGWSNRFENIWLKIKQKKFISAH